MTISHLQMELTRWLGLYGDLDVVFVEGDSLPQVDRVLLAEYDDGVKQVVLCKGSFADELAADVNGAN